MRALYSLLGVGTVVCALLVAAGEAGRWVALADILTHFRPHLAIALGTFGLAALPVRRWALATLAVAGCAWATASAMTTGACPPPAADNAAGGPAVSVLTFNILGRNLELEQIVARIRAADADVVVLQEYGVVHTPIGAALADLYPEQADCSQDRGCRLALLAKTPWQTIEIGGRDAGGPPIARAVFPASGDRPGFTLIGAHIARPINIDNRQGDDLAALAARVTESDGPLVVAGDFNATPWSFALGNFRTATGLCGAAGYRPSWPAALAALGLPIDQVFVSPGLAVTAELLAPAGSDHLPIRAVVGWR